MNQLWFLILYKHQLKLQKVMQSFAKFVAVFLFVIKYSVEVSAPITWVSSYYFQSGIKTYVPGASGPVDEDITVVYATPLTGPADRFMALGFVDFQYLISTTSIYYALQIQGIGQAGFIVNMKALDSQYFRSLRFTYLTVDPAFPYAFSISYFTQSLGAPEVGPFLLQADVNFTASTGVVLDLTHDNAMLAFQTFMTATSDTICYQALLEFYLVNQSFYRASLQTNCEMNVTFWGFSRMIFDKTDIESFGTCFFDYGSFQAIDGDDSTLTKTFQYFQSDNFMFGMNSYSLSNEDLQFASTLDQTTTVVSNTAFKKLKFMYWAFSYRTCLADYPYFSLDVMLCFDSCDVRYFQNEESMICERCHYSCYTCTNVTDDECDSCNQTTDFRYLNGTSCFPLPGYFDNSTTIAAPCMDNCLECLDENTCSVCENGYSVNGSSQCECVPDTLNCISCDTPDICLGCDVGYELIGGECQCVPDDSNCSVCVISSQCTECFPGFALVGVTCVACEENCQVCTNETFCDSCFAGYGLLNNDCIACSSNCLSCSTPTACSVCETGYILQSGLCQQFTTQICGDGLIVGNQNCDDGNTEDKDGCSSQCSQQTDFECLTSLNEVPQSACSFIGQFELTKTYIEKVPYKNEVNIVFNVSNSDLAFYDDIDFSSMLQVSGNNKITKVEKLPNGQLKVTVQYYDDLQSQDLQITVNPSNANMPEISKAQLSSSTSTVIPDNNEDAHFYDPEVYDEQKILEILCYATTGLAFLGYFISMYQGKMIGVEMMGVLQIAFLSLITLSFLNPSFTGLKSLSFANGYNRISSNSNLQDPYITEQPKGILLFSRFIQNYNIDLVLICLPVIVGLVAFIYYYFKYKKEADFLKMSAEEQQKKSKVKKIWQRSFGEYTFMGIMFSGYVIMFSCGIEYTYGAKYDDGLGIGSIIECSLLLLLFCGYFVFFILRPKYFGEFSDEFKQNSFLSKHFYHVMMVERLVTGIVLGLTFTFSFICILPIVIFLLLAIFIMVKKPYKRLYNNYRAFTNMLISIFCLSVYTFYRNNTEDNSASQISRVFPFIICALLLISMIYNLIALFYTIYKRCRQDKLKQNESELHGNLKNLATTAAMSPDRTFSGFQQKDVPALSRRQIRLPSVYGKLKQIPFNDQLHKKMMIEYDAI